MPTNGRARTIIRSPVLSENGLIRFDTNDTNIKNMMSANGIVDKYERDWLTKFNRFGVIDPYNALLTTKEYIFITKPDLCLLNSAGQINGAISNSPFFQDAINRYKNIAEQLQGSISENDSPFMNLLSNSITSSMDLPGISADSIETGANIYGTKISYRGTSARSDEDHDFSLEFEDTKYLDIYMLFKMYDEYEKLKWGAAIDYLHDDAARWRSYMINKVLHDQVSIYKIVVGEDGYRIVYWARVTGCYPNSIPRDAFSDMNNSEPQKLTVGWKGHFVRDMDPVILSQFNKLVQKKATGRVELPLYDTENHYMNGQWASTPYIDIRTITDSKHGTHREYFLRWLA